MLQSWCWWQTEARFRWHRLSERKKVYWMGTVWNPSYFFYKIKMYSDRNRTLSFELVELQNDLFIFNWRGGSFCSAIEYLYKSSSRLLQVAPSFLQCLNVASLHPVAQRALTQECLKALSKPLGTKTRLWVRTGSVCCHQIWLELQLYQERW